MSWLDKFFPSKLQQKDPEIKILDVEELKAAANWNQVFQTAADLNFGSDKVVKPYEQVVNVYKAVKAIADNVPQAELVFKDWNSEKEIYPREIMDLFDNPNPLMTRNEFIQAVAGYLALYGECVILKTKSVGQATGARKMPAELWPVNPSLVTQETTLNAVKEWSYNGQTFGPNEVIFIKDFNPHSIFRGLAPTKVLSKVIEIDWASLVYSKAFFDNDATPGFMLTTDKPLTEPQKTRLNEWLNKTHKGASKAFRSVVLDNGITPKTVGANARDSQLIEQRNYVREEILGVWRVPKALFNITDTLNYATFMGQMKIFWLYGIEPILGKLADAFNKHLIVPAFPAIYCEFDVSGVAAFQEDYKEKITTGKILIDMGFTANEVNEKMKLGFEAKPWRDVAWISAGMIPADPSYEGPGAFGGSDPAQVDPVKGKTAPKRALVDPKATGGADGKGIGFEQTGELWKGFVGRHERVERKFDKKLQAYFYNQRREVLKRLSESVGKSIASKRLDFAGMDWANQDEILKKMSSIYLMQAIQAGAEYGAAVADQQATEGAVEHQQSVLLNTMTDRITRVNRTIRRQLGDSANLALEVGLRTGMTSDEIAENIKESVRGIYNMADTRAKLIARTEVTAAMNGGSLVYYKAIGATGKIWITANDEVVRETHRDCQAEGEVGIDDQFSSNQMQGPGLGDDPAEVCNCRCSLKPTFK